MAKMRLEPPVDATPVINGRSSPKTLVILNGKCLHGVKRLDYLWDSEKGCSASLVGDRSEVMQALARKQNKATVDVVFWDKGAFRHSNTLLGCRWIVMPHKGDDTLVDLRPLEIMFAGASPGHPGETHISPHFVAPGNKPFGYTQACMLSPQCPSIWVNRERDDKHTQALWLHPDPQVMVQWTKAQEERKRVKELEGIIQANEAEKAELHRQHKAMGETLTGAQKTASDAIEAKRKLEQELATESAKLGRLQTELDALRSTSGAVNPAEVTGSFLRVADTLTIESADPRVSGKWIRPRETKIDNCPLPENYLVWVRDRDGSIECFETDAKAMWRVYTGPGALGGSVWYVYVDAKLIAAGPCDAHEGGLKLGVAGARRAWRKRHESKGATKP